MLIKTKQLPPTLFMLQCCCKLWNGESTWAPASPLFLPNTWLVAVSFISTGSGQPTVWGKALALSQSQFDQESFLVLELLRLNKLTSKKVTPMSSSTTAADNSYPSKPEIALLSRVFSLLPLTMKSRPWSGVIDYDLMAFNSITRMVYKTMHNLLEMLVLNSFLSKRSNIPADEYTRVSQRHGP